MSKARKEKMLRLEEEARKKAPETETERLKAAANKKLLSHADSLQEVSSKSCAATCCPCTSLFIGLQMCCCIPCLEWLDTLPPPLSHPLLIFPSPSLTLSYSPTLPPSHPVFLCLALLLPHALSLCRMPMQEEKDEVKHMNQMMLYSKCVTIRDAQIKDKQQRMLETQDEAKKQDLLMEIERIKVGTAAVGVRRTSACHDDG